MVKIKVNCENAVQFLVEASLCTTLDALVHDLTYIYNGVLVIRQAATNIGGFARRLAAHTEELPDTPPSAPHSTLAEPSVILMKVTAEALARVSSAQLESGKCLTKDIIVRTKEMLKETLSALELPEAAEEERKPLLISVDNGEIALSQCDAKLWWAGKELCRENELRNYFGNNEKTTVTVTLSSQAPARNKPAEAQFNEYLLFQTKRQKDFEDLDPDDEAEAYDRDYLRKSVHGLMDIKWKP
ncbi:cilia- and flagella-associated protein 298-B-like [Dermacentor andersoni]|uniref:cilia- and flagella-associated protein 298-B-like n=1 Tax=Dermacentor andersoni TaxID=34620 RepID=UPI0021554A61|nr:cilia- and flagella-associated protein 298-B-like [Dermacentor andersoni]